MDLDTRKGKLLTHYCQKQPEKYYQIDSFNVFDDLIGPPDENGVYCMGGETWELMNSPFVARLLIKDTAQKSEVVDSLKSMLNWITNGCDRCGGFTICHSACEKKELSDEQVKAICEWEKTYHKKEHEENISF